MKLSNLEITNFLSVQSAEVDLSNKGLVLVVGDNKDSEAFDSNGAGKSTIFSEAIAWVLFGETLRGYKGDDVINNKVGKGTCVSLGVEDDNDDYYEIRRHRKHKTFKNSVILFKNGEEISGKSDADTNKMIENLLQMDFLSFTNSVLFGQGISKKFASSTDGEQKKILEKMLQIDIFKSCQELAKAKIAAWNTKLVEAKHSMDLKQSQLDNTRQTISSLQQKEENLADEVANRVQELNEEIQSLTLELESLGDGTDIKEKMDEKMELIKGLDMKLSKFDSLSSAKLTLVGEIRVLEQSIKSSNKELDKYAEQLQKLKSGTAICPTCKRPLDKTNNTSSIKAVKEDILRVSDELDRDEADLKELLTVLESTNRKLDSKKPLEDAKEVLRDEYQDLNGEYRLYNTRVMNAKSQIKQAERQIKEQNQLLETAYSELIEQNVALAQQLEKDIKGIDKDIKKCEENIDHYNFWVTAYGNQGIKSELLDSVTPFLNQRANYYLSKLSDSTIDVEFCTQTELKSGEKKDKFSVAVNNKNGDSSYKGNSGGEQRRIDVAVNMALQDLVQSRSNKKIDLIVYDEAFDALDKAGCETVITLLKEKAKLCHSVIVITHNEALQDLFDRTITITKSGGATVISEQ